MKKNAAFTLIELLVVIAIIAILATIAVPNILGAIETAHASTDAANLSSIGKGVQRYLIDNEDDFFKTSGRPWPQALNQYLNDWRVFRSPFDKRAIPNTQPYPISYGMNKNCMDTSAGQWTAPSQLLIAADQKVAEKGANQFNGQSTQAPVIQPGQGLGVYKSGKMINCLFGDYHAVATNMTDFKDVQSQKGQLRWIPLSVQQP
jgi:prepilin-type N-terminal cleavage/methylation domain-containing protein